MYKTSNGGYVDVESLNKKRNIKRVEKVKLSPGSVNYARGEILVLPAASLSRAEEEGTYGMFVDLDSLKPYIGNEYDNIITSENKRTK